MSSIDLKKGKSFRKSVIKVIKSNQKVYLQKANLTEEQKSYFERQFKKMNRYLNSLLRKELLSINQTKNFIKVNRQIQRISGYCQTNKLFRYNFYEEKIVLNNILISIYEINLESNYDKKCASYGESLLNCYLDTLIILFDRHSEKDITKNFPFLNYPPSGENLELDVNFENLKLAFEFQGEYHYVDSRIQKKDKFKLSAMNRERRILIPVNVSQLQTDEIVDLILNAIINS
ncbi:TPA: hypothetical protein U1Y72_001877, partial [Streptococcus suis]|nr:hypothetical protein [Streptococcus suis]